MKNRGLKRGMNNGVGNTGQQKFPPVRQASNKADSNSQADSKHTDSRSQAEAKTPTTQASAKESKGRLGLPPKSGEGASQKANFQLEIEGEHVDLTKKPAGPNDKNKKAEAEEDEDYFQARVLKGIPEIYAGNAELRELAMALQR